MRARPDKCFATSLVLGSDGRYGRTDPALTIGGGRMTYLDDFFKVENNSLELTRIFKESFKDQRWAWEKSVRAEKRDRDAEREKGCISISILRPYTFFSRSPLVFKTLFENTWMMLTFDILVSPSTQSPLKSTAVGLLKRSFALFWNPSTQTL